MNYLSVCSGIEAWSVATRGLPFTAAAFSEIEPFPSAVLKHRFPDVPNLGDFTRIEPHHVGPIDLLVGGTPCQSFSVAGKRAGLDDPRGNLTMEFLRLAARTHPRWIVWENVPGVLSIDKGRTFGAFLGALGQLGYGTAYRVLDAQYFGVPQRRRRVFVVGYLGGDWRRAAAVLFEPEGVRGNFAPGKAKGEDVAGTLAARAGSGGGCGPETECPVIPDYSVALSTRQERSDAETQTLIPTLAHALRGTGFDASEDGTGRGTPLVPVAFSCKDHGADAGGLAPTLRAMGGNRANAGGQVAVFDPNQITSKANRSVPKPGECHTLPAVGNAPVAFSLELTNQGSGGNVGFHDSAKPVRTLSTGGPPGVAGVRRLTPRETERLQGFPDDWTLVPYRNKPASDGPRYKAVGNSMAVPVMRYIAERIVAVEGIE